jgi:Holliday junction resolvase RusA-like endonuclease|tara:strand:+ start:545 stop:1057 length:513 start_codon:yes stop_codon:yes gene_type:complete
MSEWLFGARIPGDPIGKGRPRGTARGGVVRLYTPKKTSDWESGAALVLGQYWRRAPLDECVEVEIVAMAHRPKRLLRKKDPDGLIWKGSKPDCDNIEKCVLDSLVKAGVLRDDSFVVRCEVMDFYCERDRGPRLYVRLRPIGPEPVEGWWDLVDSIPIVIDGAEYGVCDW